MTIITNRPAWTRQAVTSTWFTIAAVAFVLYPALRPWSSEVGLDGARAFASAWWPVAHLLGMVGFVAIAVALRHTSSDQPSRRAETWAWASVALLLPYYGAEAFGLHVLGRHVVATGDTGALDAVNDFRYGGLPITVFTLGLVALAVVGVRLMLAYRADVSLARAGAALAGLGLVTYLPQFFGGPTLRVTHGAVLAAGLLLLALAHTPGRMRERA